MPRTLAAAVRRFIGPSSRSRGEAYFHSGRVSGIDADAMTFSASVRGTRRYDVSLTLDDDRLVVKCTCPYFEGSIEPCKHIWAAILAADQARAFQVPAGLSLDFDDDSMDAAELDDPGDEDVEEDDAAGFSGGTRRARKRPLTRAQRLAVAEKMKRYWAERRRGLTPSTAPAPSRSPGPPVRPTPDVRESMKCPSVRRFTAKQRHAVAARMKQYWAERRRRVTPSPPSASPSPRPNRPSARPAPPAHPAPPPVWQTFLSRVMPSQSEEVSARALHTGELIYILDLARSKMAGGLR